MSPPTAVDSIRRNTSAENGITVQTRDRLVRDTGVLLSRAGVVVSRAKVSRLARGWDGALTASGAGYIAYLADKLRLTIQQRRVVAEQYARVVGYADPTGETAVRNLMRGVAS